MPCQLLKLLALNEDVSSFLVTSLEGVSKSFRTGRLEWELQMVHPSATKFNRIAILWVSLVSFAAITHCVASQRLFFVVVYLIDLVRKLLGTPSYVITKLNPVRVRTRDLPDTSINASHYTAALGCLRTMRVGNKRRIKWGVI